MIKLTKYILLILVFSSCKKENVNPDLKCPGLPFEMYSEWKWGAIKYPNSNWQELNVGTLQNIEITETQFIYQNVNGFDFNYIHLGCGIISGFCDYQNVFVEINSDTLYFTGVNDQIKWRLYKLQ